MKTILVDDEPLSMEQFKIECEGIPYLEVAGLFQDSVEALKYAEQHVIEFALLDIDMPVMNGLELAEQLRTLYSDIVIVFVTAHPEHALSAMRMKADAFILKPYDRADIEDAVERARLLSGRQKKRVFFHTFGTFDMFIDGKIVPIPNQKAKELLALCVDKGGIVTMEEAIRQIWQIEMADNLSKQKYRTAVMNIGNILEQYKVQDIFIRKRGFVAIKKEKVDGDVYRFLERNSPEISTAYWGEYMTGYTWAHDTNQRLMEMKNGARPLALV